MSDEAIGREIRQLREDIRDDLGEIKTQLSLLLPREVYTAHHDAIKSRMSKLEADVERLEQQTAKAEDKRQTSTLQRWGMIIIPALSVAAFIVFQLVKP